MKIISKYLLWLFLFANTNVVAQAIFTINKLAKNKKQNSISINQNNQSNQFHQWSISPGAYQLNQYLPLLQNKKVAVFANHTSTINTTHVVDSLIKCKINIVKIFAPEHGFRGNADAGEKVNNSTDLATKIPIVSLYGKHLKPSNDELFDVDIMLFDIQDVGVRFYTYISSLQYFIEAAIQNNKPLIILDRPNPNGFYIDGPVLDSSYKSFVGMQSVPVVYGMTIGEYAKMLIGEKMLDYEYTRKIDEKASLPRMLGFEEKRTQFSLTVIPCKNYTHKSKYILPIKPSPNLPDMQSVYWYPSIALFEGTVISEGRGTEHPFCIFGHPNFSNTLFSFTPISKAGAKEPKFKNINCFGYNLWNADAASVLKEMDNKLQIKYVIQAYKDFPQKDSFFIQPKIDLPHEYFFNKIMGSNIFMQQLKDGVSEETIRKSWQPRLDTFKKIRKKYLLYNDFE